MRETRKLPSVFMLNLLNTRSGRCTGRRWKGPSSQRVVEDWVQKVSEEARVVRATESDFGAKLAMLEYRVIARLPGPATLIEFEPLTGRMHQLRVQAAWRGHPVFGDALYGSLREFGPSWELPRDRVIALHARRLTLTHPTHHQVMTLEAPLPAYWSAAGIASPASGRVR